VAPLCGVSSLTMDASFDVAQLQRRQGSLAQEIKRVQEVLRKEQKAKLQRRDRRVSVATMETARCILCLTAGDMALAMQYCGHSIAMPMCEPAARIHTQLSQWWTAATPEERARCSMDCDTAMCHPRLRFANVWLTKNSLHEYVREVNVSRSMAPFSSTLVQEVERRQNICTPAVSVWSGGMLRRSKLQWLRRWRHKFHISLGRIGPRETLPAEVAVAKVAVAGVAP